MISYLDKKFNILSFEKFGNAINMFKDSKNFLLKSFSVFLYILIITITILYLDASASVGGYHEIYMFVNQFASVYNFDL